MNTADHFIKKHADTASIIGAIIAAVVWMNVKFDRIDDKFAHVEKRFTDVRQDLHEIDKRLTKVETIIYIKGLVSHEIAMQQDGKKES